jgi:inosine-uridine nucleoside N-ribohydrolase
MNQVIIDTDPGVDDALAIMMACKSKLSVAGLTTVYGNSTISNTTRNALLILQLLDSDIPVYKGAASPLKCDGLLAMSHGTNGLGSYDKSIINRKIKGKAMDFFKEYLGNSKEKSVDIIAIGPVTNIAELGEKYPSLIRKIRKILVLAGVFDEPGNVSPYAEFNVYNDPYALEVVLGFDCEKVLIPANVCRKVIFTLEDFDKIANKKLQNSIQTIAELYVNYYKKDKRYGGFKGGVMYDLLPVCYALDPTIFKVKESYVHVTPEDRLERGMTNIKVGKNPNCKLVFDADAEKIKNLFFQLINQPSS